MHLLLLHEGRLTNSIDFPSIQTNWCIVDVEILSKLKVYCEIRPEMLTLKGPSLELDWFLQRGWVQTVRGMQPGRHWAGEN